MDRLMQQVRRAQIRLAIEDYLKWLIWCMFACLLVAAVAVAVPKVFIVDGLPAAWAKWWIGGGVAAGFVTAAIATWITRRSSLEAAMEIDRRFDLRERVASSLSLSPRDLESPAGSALLSDAAKRLDRIEVGEKFRPAVGRQAWLPLLPATLAICLVMFVGNREAESSPEDIAKAEARTRVKEASEVARKALEQNRKKAEESGLKEAQQAFKELEEAAKELENSTNGDRKKATVKLNNLAKQLEDRRQKLGASEEFKKQMKQMKDFGKGPGDKVADAIKQGDWEKALDEMNNLKEKLAKDNLTAEEKKQLAEQLNKMKDKLAQAAEANRETMDKLREQIEEQKAQGNLAKAGELQQKLDELAQKQPQMNKLEELAQKMGDCQQCMQNGDKEGAAQAMAQMAEQLEQMKQELDEMEMLDQAMEQLEMAKNAMGCKQCNGGGCQACQGGMGKMGQGNQQGKMAGNGMGEGPGGGFRPDEENETKFRESRVRQNPGKGAATFGGLVSGPNIKGDSSAAVEEEMAAIKPKAADPLTIERLPRSQAEHSKEYFEQLRDQ